MLLEDGKARRLETNANLYMQDLQMLQDAVEDEGDETRPRGCKYPTPPCALAKILPETTVRA